MDTTLLLLNPLANPTPASAANPASISQSAIARIRRLLRNSSANCGRIVSLFISEAELARIRAAAAAHGPSTEVLATTRFVIATAQGGQAHLSLELQCRGTGPVHITTYEEWTSLP